MKMFKVRTKDDVVHEVVMQAERGIPVHLTIGPDAAAVLDEGSDAFSVEQMERAVLHELAVHPEKESVFVRAFFEVDGRDFMASCSVFRDGDGVSYPWPFRES